MAETQDVRGGLVHRGQWASITRAYHSVIQNSPQNFSSKFSPRFCMVWSSRSFPSLPSHPAPPMKLPQCSFHHAGPFLEKKQRAALSLLDLTFWCLCDLTPVFPGHLMPPCSFSQAPSWPAHPHSFPHLYLLPLLSPRCPSPPRSAAKSHTLCHT